MGRRLLFATLAVCAAAALLLGVACGASYVGESPGDDASVPDATPFSFDAEAGTPDSGVSPSGFVRKLHIVPGDAIPVGYVVRVPIDFGPIIAAGHVAADLSDVHVFGPDGEVARVVDRTPRMPSNVFWFAITGALSAPDDSYEIRYGQADGGDALT